MAKKKSIRVDFVKSCITYNKLNKIAISGIENICKRLNLDNIFDVINGKFAIPSKRPSGKKSSSKRVAKMRYRICGLQVLRTSDRRTGIRLKPEYWRFTFYVEPHAIRLQIDVEDVWYFNTYDPG